jgi:ATPase involved in DNA repair
MELKRLEVENFRQFYGTQEVSFSLEESNNVTVVHGDNGAGKTTLLNTFLWLFYNELTLPQPDKIATERALDEASVNSRVPARVKLEFKDQGRQYTAERKQVFQKRSQTDLSGVQVDEDLTLEYIDEHGNHKQRNNPTSALKRILPQRLREIFFFDGETISELTADDGQQKVQSAIRNIMGLEILERAIRHLDTVEGRFEDTMDEYGSNELSDLVSKKQDIKSKIDSLENERENLQQSRTETERELTQTEERLSELEDSRELQEERDRLRTNLDNIDTDIKNIDDETGSVISDSGHLPFAMPAVEETARMLQEKRRKGEIPSEIKTQFVEDLLDIEECICGRPLHHGSGAREEVSQWRERAGSTELEEAAMNIVGRLSEIGERQTDLYDDVDELLAERSAKRDRKQKLQEQLDEISETLSEIETEDIGKLEQRRQDLKSDIEELSKSIGAVEREIDDCEETLSEIEEDISDAREENEVANRARRRARTAGYLRDQIDALFKKYQDKVRKSVNDKVNQTFQSIIEKEYYAQISDEYALRILKDVGDTEQELVAKSTGERQVASLSFIASLVSLAKNQYESDQDTTYFTGGIYPMLMDSPFGYLDPTYQRRVSQKLPEMAEQVVVLVTESQWSDAVAGELADIAGQRYKLQYHDEQKYEYTEIVPTGETY